MGHLRGDCVAVRLLGKKPVAPDAFPVSAGSGKGRGQGDAFFGVSVPSRTLVLCYFDGQRGNIVCLGKQTTCPRLLGEPTPFKGSPSTSHPGLKMGRSARVSWPFEPFGSRLRTWRFKAPLLRSLLSNGRSARRRLGQPLPCRTPACPRGLKSKTCPSPLPRTARWTRLWTLFRKGRTSS